MPSQSPKNMTYQDYKQVPEVEHLAVRFREQNLQFSGYFNYAISKAIQQNGKGSKDELIRLVMEILEGELIRYSNERQERGRRQSAWLFGLFHSRKSRV